MRAFRTVVCAVIAAMAATAMADEAKPGPKFEFHGFIGGSLFAQDAVFNGYGEQIFYLTKQPNQDKITMGGDARQTRLNFSLAGPTVFGGAVPKGVVEVDFFSALSNVVSATAVNTGPVAVTPRLRLSYAELNWGPTIFRFGQDNDLVNGTFGATSVGHIPQTYAYSAGQLGTRHLDAEVFQTLPAGDMKLELALQVQSSIQLPGTANSNIDTYNNQLSPAESSGLPGLEGRIRLVVPKMLDVFVAGHWNKIDRNGQDNTLTTGPVGATTNNRFGDSQQIVAGQVGAKVTAGPLTLQGQAYVGKNLAFETAGLGQTVNVNQGDVHEWGAWGQLGFNITPEFSAWAFLGTEKLNYAEAIAVFGANARLQNVTTAGMLRYMDGGYALALEWVHMHTKYNAVQPDRIAAPNAVLDGNQLMLSGFYFF